VSLWGQAAEIARVDLRIERRVGDVLRIIIPFGVVALLVFPLALPLVIGGSQTLESLTRGAGILPWLLLLVATDLALAVAGVGLARPIEEASR
jgi:hypothetical protein